MAAESGVSIGSLSAGIEGELTLYPASDELRNRTFATQNAWRDRCAKVPFEDWGGYFQGRYYQDLAIERVLEAIADNMQRILKTALRWYCSIALRWVAARVKQWCWLL